MRQVIILAQNTIKALIRKKDFYVFFMMLSALLAFLLSEDLFNIHDISRYVKDIGFFCIWLFSFIIAVTFSAKQLPEEMESKAILPLLSKPVSRFQLLAGRFFGSTSAAAGAFTVFYIVYIAAVFAKGEGVTPVLFMQAYVLGVCFISLVCAISMFLTLYLTFSASVTFSFVLYFAVMWFSDELRTVTITSKGLGSALLNVVYYMIPHYEFYDLRIRLVHLWEPLPAWIMLALIAYTALYVVLILNFAHQTLKNRFL